LGNLWSEDDSGVVRKKEGGGLGREGPFDTMNNSSRSGGGGKGGGWNVLFDKKVRHVTHREERSEGKGSRLSEEGRIHHAPALPSGKLYQGAKPRKCENKGERSTETGSAIQPSHAESPLWAAKTFIEQRA